MMLNLDKQLANLGQLEEAQPLKRSSSKFRVKKSRILMPNMSLQSKKEKQNKPIRSQSKFSKNFRKRSQSTQEAKIIMTKMEDRNCELDKIMQNEEKEFKFIEKYSGNKENRKIEGLSLLRVKKNELKKHLTFQWSQEYTESLQEYIELWSKNIFQGQIQKWAFSDRLCIIDHDNKSYEFFSYKPNQENVPPNQAIIMQCCYEHFRNKQIQDNSTFKIYLCVLFSGKKVISSFMWVNRPIQMNSQNQILERIAKKIQLYAHPKLGSAAQLDSIIRLYNAWGKMSYIKLSVIVPVILKLRKQANNLKRCGIMDVENLLGPKKSLPFFYIPPAYNRRGHYKLSLYEMNNNKHPIQP